MSTQPSISGWIYRPNVILAAACAIAVLILGPRSTLGIFTTPITESNGWGRDIFALAIGVQHLLWGLMQPAAGALADRYGCRYIIILGAVLYALGIALMPLSTSPESFVLTAGVLVGFGLAGTGFPVVVAALGRLIPEKRRSAALGVATASGSLGQFLFSPFGQYFITHYGWPVALWLMASAVLAVLILATPFAADRPANRPPTTSPRMGFGVAVRTAFQSRSYVLLVVGFFVCGFHVSFVMAHLPPYLTDIGVTQTLAAWTISLIGLFNVIGAFSAGLLGGRFSKRYLLSALYALRAVAIGAFLLSAKSDIAIVLFASALGLLWLSTVPLTSGLVAVIVGTRYLGTLFGFVFMSHQAGAFLGVWLGGYLFERTGSYDSMWLLGIALSCLASILHWPIEERRARAFADPVTA